MRAENPSHAHALVVVDELVRCGVTDAVLAPGSRSAALAMAFHDDPRIRLHVEIDERSAGFLAIGLARVQGRPAAVVTTSGSAVANLHPAVVEADTGRVPLLLLTADRPPELRHTGANQTIVQPGLFGGATRFAVDVGVAEDRPGIVAYWRSTVSRAVAEAAGLSGPPGPVHCNLPFREPTVPLADDGRAPPAEAFGQPLDGRADQRPWTAVDRAVRRLDPVRTAALADRIRAVERGLVVAGQATLRPEPLHALARAVGWPVLAEPASGARSGDHAIACPHHLVADADLARTHRPELVLRVGQPGLSPPLERLLSADVPQIVIDPHGAWHDPARAVGELVVADPDQACEDLARAVADGTAPERDGGWLDAWRRADAAARAAVDAVLDRETRPTEPRVARDLGACLPSGSALVVASSMPVRDLHRYLAPRDGLTVVANRGASGVDGTVSTGLGVALAHDGPTVALTGDIALLHDSNGFLLAPDAPRLDATVVVVDNDGGGIFHHLPQARFPASFERVFATPHGRDLADLARLHRLGYHAVDRADGIPEAVLGTLDDGGLHLVHVRTDRHANVALHERITAAVREALDAVADGPG